MKSACHSGVNFCTRGHPSAWRGWTRTNHLIEINVAVLRRHYELLPRYLTIIRQYAPDITINSGVWLNGADHAYGFRRERLRAGIGYGPAISEGARKCPSEQLVSLVPERWALA